MKMKVGRDAKADIRACRGSAASHRRRAAELFVDANGAYVVQQALAQAQHFAEERVTWFEEPVFREDYAGTRHVREHAPPGMEISDGEYGYGLYEFARMIEAEMLDVLQADATRCGGFSGLAGGRRLCQTAMTPALDALCAASAPSRRDGVQATAPYRVLLRPLRIERMFFDGATEPENGELSPDPNRPGIGLEFRRHDAERYASIEIAR